MTARSRSLLGAAGAFLILLGACVVWGAAARGTGNHNVVVIMTDDQTLASLPYMPNVNNLLAAQGTTFSNYYVATPNCCPSRAEYYTGQYAHNNGVKDNLPPELSGHGGNRLFRLVHDETIAVWLQRAGYHTVHVGKYLNGYGNPKEDSADITPPPGWSRWLGTIDPTTYQFYNYSVSVDGERVDFGDTAADYQGDVQGAQVVAEIEEATARGSRFFVSWTPLAPHAGTRYSPAGDPFPDSVTAVPAPRHEGMFAAEGLAATPSRVFGADAVGAVTSSGKPAFVRARVEQLPPDPGWLTDTWRAELESLQAIDEWVGQIYATLDRLGILDDTLIVFTSDNGLFYGEHGLTNKGMLYEEAVHVPLVVRGPGFPAGLVAEQFAVNVDLAPTILEATGASSPFALDGTALQQMTFSPSTLADRAILLEQWFSFSQVRTDAIRVGQWSYMEWFDRDAQGEEVFFHQELYDLEADPYQLTNLALVGGYESTIDELAARLARLRTCAGSTCER